MRSAKHVCLYGRAGFGRRSGADLPLMLMIKKPCDCIHGILSQGGAEKPISYTYCNYSKKFSFPYYIYASTESISISIRYRMNRSTCGRSIYACL